MEPAGELWGYWINHAQSLRWLIAFHTIVIFLLAIGWFHSLKKPPVVVRVDQVGNAATIPNLRLNNEPSDVEITAFAKEFLKSYIELNSQTIQKDLARALNMMSRRFQTAHLKELRKDNFLGKIVQANIRTELEVTELHITSKLPSRVELDVRGITSTFPLEDTQAPPSKKGFISKLVLLFVERTEPTPNGLVVDDYRSKIVPLEELLPEKVFKELS